MDTIPNLRWAPRLARLYSEEVRKLEAMHADRLSPGATTWAEAVEALFQKMVKAGPVKGSRLIQKAIDYLDSIDGDQRSHFMIVANCGRRSAFLMFASFSIDRHPDPGVREEGLNIKLYVIRSSRSCPARTTGIPVSYISTHAMRRLFERGYDVSGNSHATSIFAFIGVLGFLTHHSEKHANGALSLLCGNVLAVGSQHRFTKTSCSGRQIEERFFDVRTVLDANDLIPANKSLKAQGRIAAAVVAEWFECDGESPSDKELAERIPHHSRREDGFPRLQQRSQKDVT